MVKSIVDEPPPPRDLGVSKGAEVDKVELSSALGKLGRKAARSLGDPLYGYLYTLALEDAEVLVDKGKSYGNSWKRRGGVGAFFVFARKWDRMENWVGQPRWQAPAWDIFAHIFADERKESLLEDVRDLRRYLLLVEAEIMAQNQRVQGEGDDDVGSA